MWLLFPCMPGVKGNRLYLYGLSSHQVGREMSQPGDGSGCSFAAHHPKPCVLARCTSTLLFETFGLMSESSTA